MHITKERQENDGGDRRENCLANGNLIAICQSALVELTLAKEDVQDDEDGEDEEEERYVLTLPDFVKVFFSPSFFCSAAVVWLTDIVSSL